MTGPEVLLAILLEIFRAEAVPYILGVAVLLLFAFFWRRGRHSTKQRRVITASLSLWLCVPVSILLAAAFRFSGPDALRGIAYAEPAAALVASMLIVAVVGSLVLLVFGRGVRANVTASALALVFVQFWAGLLAGCAIVGRCV
jgi:hypothetical protein